MAAALLSFVLMYPALQQTAHANPAPGEIGLEYDSYAVSENEGYVYLSVIRYNGSDGEVAVDYTTSDGTASGGSDYETAGGTLTFAAGETSKTISVPIYNDTDTEGDESFTVTLGNPTNGATLGTITGSNVSIVDDDTWIPDPPGQLQLDTASATVDEGGSFVSLLVTRTSGAGGTVTVDYGVGGGSASEGSDFTGTSGSLTFAEGETWKTIEVPILDDAEYEGNENFTVSLFNATGGASLGTITSAVVTITDNDPYVEPEGRAVFVDRIVKTEENSGIVTVTVIRKGGSAGILKIRYETADGSAIAGEDYTAAEGTLAFADGETVKTIEIQIKEDSKQERKETFQVRIWNASFAGGDFAREARNTAEITINDNDGRHR
ncbi:Calx-beta domain-containing protein [Cohnella sp. CFH 77786]|uniref:Calx-beta domain-containing protein n=1 Tax=Cohnella sp. CFH 77786 TaxID=2662265 RepID=UPI001C60BF03|nr:Calx-beta domain-containing protein [Cohnella sp. CFH 77786]